MLLIKVDRHDFEVDRRVLLERQQDVEQRVAVFAARQADHDLVARADHVEVGNGFADLAAQPLGELVAFVNLFLQCRHLFLLRAKNLESDRFAVGIHVRLLAGHPRRHHAGPGKADRQDSLAKRLLQVKVAAVGQHADFATQEIGRASCRERVFAVV